MKYRVHVWVLGFYLFDAVVALLVALTRLENPQGLLLMVLRGGQVLACLGALYLALAKPNKTKVTFLLPFIILGVHTLMNTGALLVDFPGLTNALLALFLTTLINVLTLGIFIQRMWPIMVLASVQLVSALVVLFFGPGYTGFGNYGNGDLLSSMASLYGMAASIFLALLHTRIKNLLLQKTLESSRQFSLISNNLPNSMVYQVDCGPTGATRQFTYVSDGIKALHGLEPSAVIANAMVLYERIHPEDAPVLAAREAECLAAMKEFSLEYRCLGADGGYRWYLLSSSPRIMDNGHVIWDGIELDITDRRQAEEALKQAQSEVMQQNSILNTLLDNLVSGVFMVEAPSGRPLIANKAARKLLGRGILPDASRENLNEVYASRKQNGETPYPIEQMPIIRSMYGEESHIDDMIVTRPDGTETWLEIFGSPIRNSKGAVWASLVSFQDITERKRSEQELERKVRDRTAELATTVKTLESTVQALESTQHQLVQAEKLASLGPLVAGVAHELNTPLGNALTVSTTITSLTKRIEGLMNGPLTRSELETLLLDIREGQAIIERNLTRAAELIANFKQLAVDQASHKQRSFPLKEVVDEVLQVLSPSVKKTSHHLCTDIPPDILLDSYPGPLGQVFINLINNALIHGLESKVGGTISISARPLEVEMVEVVVEDDGKGIPQELHDKVFDPFFTTQFGKGGSGLGLHIVYSLCTEVLGGELTLESALGMGTKFTLRLPLKSPPRHTLPEGCSET